MKYIKPNVCDEDNFKSLFFEFGEKLFQFLFFKYKDEDLARDCSQEAFIILWENCHKIDYPHARSYIFTVGKNKAIDFYRKKKLHLKIENDEKQIIQEEFSEEILELYPKMNLILAKLPAPSKEAFLMNRMYEMTYSEISKELNISIKAVEKRMSLALKIIREELMH
jgi:RNA polymerase sigma-70 factor (ECF subfamily)